MTKTELFTNTAITTNTEGHSEERTHAKDTEHHESPEHHETATNKTKVKESAMKDSVKNAAGWVLAVAITLTISYTNGIETTRQTSKETQLQNTGAVSLTLEKAIQLTQNANNTIAAVALTRNGASNFTTSVAPTADAITSKIDGQGRLTTAYQTLARQTFNSCVAQSATSSGSTSPMTIQVAGVETPTGDTTTI